MSNMVIDALPSTRQLTDSVVIVAEGQANVGEVQIRFSLEEGVINIINLQRGIHKRVAFNKCANWALIRNDEQVFAALAIKLGIKHMRFGRTLVLVKNRHVPPVVTPVVKESNLWLALPALVLVGLGSIATLIRR